MADANLHPEMSELAGYIDGALGAERRSAVESHLAACAACRDEVMGSSEILRTLPRPRRAWLPGLVAAAALMVALIPALRSRSHDALRDPATVAVPQPVQPTGAVSAAGRLIWTAVPNAVRYRVTLMDSAGAILWRAELSDTVAILPDSVMLRAGSPYFWRTEAETDFDRWVSSELADFLINRTAP